METQFLLLVKNRNVTKKIILNCVFVSAKFYRDEMFVNLFSAILTAIVRLLCNWEMSVGGCLGVTAVFLQQGRASRILLGLQPVKEVQSQSRPWIPFAGLLDRVGFLFAVIITCWLVVNLVPPPLPADSDA